MRITDKFIVDTGKWVALTKEDQKIINLRIYEKALNAAHMFRNRPHLQRTEVVIARADFRELGNGSLTKAQRAYDYTLIRLRRLGCDISKKPVPDAKFGMMCFTSIVMVIRRGNINIALIESQWSKVKTELKHLTNGKSRR